MIGRIRADKSNLRGSCRQAKGFPNTGYRFVSLHSIGRSIPMIVTIVLYWGGPILPRSRWLLNHTSTKCNQVLQLPSTGNPEWYSELKISYPRCQALVPTRHPEVLNAMDLARWIGSAIVCVILEICQWCGTYSGVDNSSEGVIFVVDDWLSRE